MLLMMLVPGCKTENQSCGAEIDLSADPAQRSADIAAIDDYLSSNQLFAHTDPTGIRYRVEEAGSGASAQLCNEVTMTYTATRMSDGEVFLEVSTPQVSELQNLITGLQIGIPKVNSGGTIVIYIPSVYGYGSAGTSGVPPNENLIYEVNLIEID